MMTEAEKRGNWRHELKHRINLREDLVLSQRLEKLFERDGHCGDDGTYRVTSLYFDTPYDDALREKINGVNRRKKFRLRYYGQDVSYIRLEKKSRIDGLCEKRSTMLTESQAARVLSGDTGFLAGSGDPLLEEFYSEIKGRILCPKTIVTYEREAFVYAPGNVRITLDRNIRTGLGSVDFLNPDVFTMPALESVTVLELKYDRFLPDIARHAVSVPGRTAEACSKYAVCRRFD